MKLTITIMINGNEKKDIQVNSKQTIEDTIKILQQAQFIDEKEKEQLRIKSLRRGVYIEKSNNYEEEYIFSGDILIID